MRATMAVLNFVEHILDRNVTFLKNFRGPISFTFVRLTANPYYTPDP